MTGPIIKGAERLFDVMISRPSLTFGAASKLPRSVLQRAKILESLADNPKRLITDALKNEQFLMPQGHVVTGGLAPAELTKRLSVKPVIVAGVDQTPRAVRDLTGTIRMDWSQPEHLGLEMPRQITDEQVKHLSRYFDNNQIPTVTLKLADGNQMILNKPLGAHVEDALYEANKAYAKKTNRITPKLIDQFNKEGVFRGQAGLLDDGSPVEIRSKAGENITIFDHTANREMVVHESKMSILPTTLEDQLKPNNLFSRYLDNDERVALGRLRQSLATGLGTKISRFPQLELLAGSRGMIAERLTKGRVALVDMASGERQQFENLSAAAGFARTLNRPVPDLTPDFMKALFGEGDSIGFIGPNGRPPNMGELIPTPTNLVFETRVEADKLPGAAEHIFKPMRGLFQDMQERTGLPFGDIFLNVHTRTVQRQNFNARWIHGKGEVLPEGVLPLDRIRKLAGRHANEENITAWLESGSDPSVRQSLEASMTKEEVHAAGELRKYYDALFKELGIAPDYVENYAPHWRVQAQKLGTNDIHEIWRASKGKDPIPKAAAFFADYYRTGIMDIYDTAAFRMASRYTHAGSSNRFMSEPLEQVENLLHQVSDRALMKPMNEYMQALRGFEHVEQKAMIERTLNGMFEKLPGLAGATAKGLADKMSDLAIGVGYMSTLAYRPASVLRNFGQVFHTLYPIFGNANGAFSEGLGRAMTRAGKLAAVADGAISYKSASVFGRQEMDESIPMFKKFSEAGFKLYDSADEYTRAASYWVGRENASRAIAKFMKKAGQSDPTAAKASIEQLLLDSKAFMFEKNIQSEFVRRMGTDPESAARFIGVQTADVTQFLYGRGMQPAWMRSTYGKFLGQYGTWSLWYMDYITRTTKNYIRSGHTSEAIKFIGRNALVNGAILYAGHEVLGVDLSRWLSYPSVFFSGGPGAQVMVGMSQVFRGLADVTAGSESPYGKKNLNEGLQTLAYTGLAYIPFRSAARDAMRVNNAIQSGDWTEFLASMLGAKPTEGYRVGQQIDALFPGQPLGYEEWMRYRPNAPQGPSASAVAEMALYQERAFRPGTGIPSGPAALGLSTGTTDPAVGASVPQLDTGLGLDQSQPPRTSSPREPSAESTPLNR